MKYACALLLLASGGRAEAVASALQKANGDEDLQRFVLWLPFILDSLWQPFPGDDEVIHVAMQPDGTSPKDREQASQAFGLRQIRSFINPSVENCDHEGETEEEEVIVLHPEAESLVHWEAITVVEGKFSPRWSQSREMCEFWHVPVGSHNDILSDIEVFWHELLGEDRDERALLRYLLKNHGIAPSAAKKMLLADLAKLMFEDTQKKYKQTEMATEPESPSAAKHSSDIEHSDAGKMPTGSAQAAGAMATPESGGHAQVEVTAGMSWKEAADRMERLRNQGEPFTSQRRLADAFDCSSATINKAIKNTPSLQTWAKPEDATAPKAQSLSGMKGGEYVDVITDRTASNEPNPEDVVAIREHLEREDLAPEERAFFNSLSHQDQLDYLNDPDKHAKILGRKP